MPNLSPLFVIAISMGSLTTTYAQNVPARKPITKTQTTRPLAERPLTLNELGIIHDFIDLPSTDRYLTTHDFNFFESHPDTALDQVVYTRKGVISTSDEIIGLFFCNSANNRFCTRPTIHANKAKQQHIFRVVYSPNKNIFYQLKKTVESYTNPSASTVEENSITTIYKSILYEFSFTIDNSPNYPPTYAIKMTDLVK